METNNCSLLQWELNIAYIYLKNCFRNAEEKQSVTKSKALD